jgi:hypothetical protein
MPKNSTPPVLRNYLAQLGKRGGERSKRTITPEQQHKMQQARRRARKAAKKKS